MGFFKNFGGNGVESEKKRRWIIIPPKWDLSSEESREKLLSNLKKVSEEAISKIWENVQAAETLHWKREREDAGSLEKWVNSFRSKIEWVSDSNKDMMISLLNRLVKEKRLKIITDKTWRYIDFDILDYKIHVLDVWNYKNIIKSTRRKATSYEADETNKDGMMTMSKDNDTWWDVANETVMKSILGKLTENYSYMKPGRNWDNHDEDIAFFMLMTQCVGEFLLNNDRVLKCYYDFRWFRDMRDNATGQLILVKKR